MKQNVRIVTGLERVAFFSMKRVNPLTNVSGFFRRKSEALNTADGTSCSKTLGPVVKKRKDDQVSQVRIPILHRAEGSERTRDKALRRFRYGCLLPGCAAGYFSALTATTHRKQTSMMALLPWLESLQALSTESNCTPARVCAEVANVFYVRTAEVGLLRLEGQILTFLFPAEL